MGNTEFKECSLSREQLISYTSSSVFSVAEIRALWFHFMVISSNQEGISRSQFQAAMLFRDSSLLDRIFRAVDKDDNNSISFPEYLQLLSAMSLKASNEDKLKLSFQIYDFDGDGKISISDLTSMLAATLREHDIVITRSEIDEIVSKTMQDICIAEKGFLHFSEFAHMITLYPHMLTHLTLNVSGIIAKYTATHGVTFASPRR